MTGVNLWKGKAWIFLVQASDSIMDVLVVGLAITGSLVIARFAMMLLLSAIHARRVRREGFAWGPPVTEPVTVLVPAYNEAKCIENTVRSLMASEHPVEVIVVDDGSADGTARIVEAMNLPNVRVVRQVNAGKPAALNRGLANASHDLIVMMDGDTVFEPATVRELVQPFGDPRVGAVAGNAKVGNRDSLIGAWQHIEYVMGFNLDRRMYDILRCMPTIPGAVGAFRRSALERVGGMSDDTLAEDTDITMAMHRDGWRVVYAEKARAWTEAPETVQQLWSQRYRWSYGTMQAIWKHRGALLDRGPSGRFGRVGLPLVALFMVIAPILAPLIDVFLLYGLVFGPTEKTFLAWLGVLAIQAFCAAYAFRLDRERMTHLVSLPLQQILYRQLMYVVLLQSWITALTGAACAGRSCGGPGSWRRRAARCRPSAAAVVVTGGRWHDARIHDRDEPRAGVRSRIDAGVRDSPTAPAGTGVGAHADEGQGGGGRDRYLDLLRSVALVRVVVYHLFGWAWLSVLFPSMGVMFALAGSLMARSLNRPSLGVIKGRLRRLLPPLWAFSAVVLVMMFGMGWNPLKDPDLGVLGGVRRRSSTTSCRSAHRRTPSTGGSESGLLESSWADQAAGPLWYLRAYLWFVIASPLLLWAFRRIPWATLLAPLALTAVVGTGLVTIPGETGNAVSDFAVYGSCWVLGFAHHEGVLKQVPRYLAVPGATLIMGFGLWWASGHLGPDGWDLNDIPLAQATWSFGVVVILLQYAPSWQELPGRLARWDKLDPLQQPRRHDLPLAQPPHHGHGPDHRPALQPPLPGERRGNVLPRQGGHVPDVRTDLAADRGGDPHVRMDRGHRRQAKAAVVAQRGSGGGVGGGGLREWGPPAVSVSVTGVGWVWGVVRARLGG